MIGTSRHVSKVLISNGSVPSAMVLFSEWSLTVWLAVCVQASCEWILPQKFRVWEPTTRELLFEYDIVSYEGGKERKGEWQIDDWEKKEQVKVNGCDAS